MKYLILLLMIGCSSDWEVLGPSNVPAPPDEISDFDGGWCFDNTQAGGKRTCELTRQECFMSIVYDNDLYTGNFCENESDTNYAIGR